jgi:glycosyltransferase involved in cell wall biosynthesis
MRKPKISFVMPVKNCGSFIAQTFKSLIGQSLKDIEIIAVDDFSTDSTFEVMEYFKNKDNRIRLFKTTEWMGAGWCRNEGNKYSLADIICVTDAGDIYHKNKAKITYNYFKKHPDTDILYHSVNNVDIQGRPQRTQMAFNYDYKNYPRGISHPTVAYKKEIILKHPYRTDCKHTDQYEALFIELFKEGYKFVPIMNVLMRKVDLSHLDTFRDIKEATKQKIRIYKEFNVSIDDTFWKRAGLEKDAIF